MSSSGEKRTRDKEEREGASPVTKRPRRQSSEGEEEREGDTQPARTLVGPVYPVSDDPAVVAEFNRALRNITGEGDAVLCAVSASLLGHFVESVGRFSKEMCFVPVVADSSSAGLVACVLGSANTTILNGFFPGPVAGFAGGNAAAPGALGAPTSVSLGKGGRFPGALGLCGTGNSGKVLLTVRPESVGIVPVHTGSGSGSGGGIYVRTSATVACIKGERPFFYQPSLPGIYEYGILINPVLFNDLITKITNGAAVQESGITVQLIRYQAGRIGRKDGGASYILALSGHLDVQSSCETWIPSVSVEAAAAAREIQMPGICDFSFTAGSPVDSRIQVSSSIIDFRSNGSNSNSGSGGGGACHRRVDSPTTTADIFDDEREDEQEGEEEDSLSSCRTIDDVMKTLRDPCVVVSQLYSSKLLRDALHPTGNAGYGLGAEFSVFLTNALPIVLQTITGDGAVVQTLVQYRDDEEGETGSNARS